MSHSLIEYDRAVKEARAGRGRSVSDEELYDHMLKNYPEFSRLPSLQDVIKHAIGGGYAEVIDEVHKSEISRLDAVNSDLQAALEMMLDYVNSLPAIPCISKAMAVVGAARSALSKAKGVSA